MSFMVASALRMSLPVGIAGRPAYRPSIYPGQPWRPGTSPPAPLSDDGPSADIRIGYARCSALTQELQSQLDALAAHGIPREKPTIGCSAAA
ncbi:hypothetical protein ACWEPC_06700 [Nonomuraea sp. NPDC004297]